MKTENSNETIVDNIFSLLKSIGSHLAIMLLLSCFVGGLVAPMFYRSLAEEIQYPSPSYYIKLTILKIGLWGICVVSWTILVVANLRHISAIG